VATLDVLSSAEALAAVNLTADSTGRLVILTSAVSQQLDELCGPVVQRTVTAETHDGGSTFIALDDRPVASVTTVTEYAGTTSTTLTAESNTSKTGNDYFLDTGGVIRRRSGGGDSRFPTGRGNVAVTYVAGRAANTAAVDAKFKQAAAMMLRNLWVSEAASGSETIGAFTDQIAVNPLLGPGMLNKVAALLSGEMKAPSV
jgi:hypothetical protein